MAETTPRSNDVEWGGKDGGGDFRQPKSSSFVPKRAVGRKPVFRRYIRARAHTQFTRPPPGRVYVRLSCFFSGGGEGES